MRNLSRVLAIALASLVGLAGCQASTDKVDSGGVILTISDFDALPITVSVASTIAAGGVAQIGRITVQNIVKNSSQSTSSLMNVEIQSYEVTFRRADNGTKTPPALIEYIFGSAPVGGTYVLDNGPFMRLDQFNTPPLSDLYRYGFDKETNSQVVRLTVGIRFFGTTLAGKRVESNTAYFTVDFVP